MRVQEKLKRARISYGTLAALVFLLCAGTGHFLLSAQSASVPYGAELQEEQNPSVASQKEVFNLSESSAHKGSDDDISGEGTTQLKNQELQAMTLGELEDILSNPQVPVHTKGLFHEDFEDLARAVLDTYQEKHCLLAQASYLDISGNTWGCVIGTPFGSEFCIIQKVDATTTKLTVLSLKPEDFRDILSEEEERE